MRFTARYSAKHTDAADAKRLELWGTFALTGQFLEFRARPQHKQIGIMHTAVRFPIG